MPKTSLEKSVLLDSFELLTSTVANAKMFRKDQRKIWSYCSSTSTSTRPKSVAGNFERNLEGSTRNVFLRLDVFFFFSFKTQNTRKFRKKRRRIKKNRAKSRKFGSIEREERKTEAPPSISVRTCSILMARAVPRSMIQAIEFVRSLASKTCVCMWKLTDGNDGEAGPWPRVGSTLVDRDPSVAAQSQLVGRRERIHRARSVDRTVSSIVFTSGPHPRIVVAQRNRKCWRNEPGTGDVAPACQRYSPETTIALSLSLSARELPRSSPTTDDNPLSSPLLSSFLFFVFFFFFLVFSFSSLCLSLPFLGSRGSLGWPFLSLSVASSRTVPRLETWSAGEDSGGSMRSHVEDYRDTEECTGCWWTGLERRRRRRRCVTGTVRRLLVSS